MLLLVGGIAFYLIAREKPEDMGFASPHDDAVDEAATANVDDSESSLSRYKAVLSNWRLLVAGLAIGFQNAARYGLLVWVPVHFLGANWTKAAADTAVIDPRWISIALPVGMAFGAFTNGWVSDKFFNSRRSSAIVLYMVLAAITALYMYTIPTTAVYQGLAVLFLCGFFVYGPQSSFWALCPDLVGHKRAGTATGIMNFCAYLFAGLGEPIIGHFMDTRGETSVVFLIVSMCAAASATVASFIRR